MQYEVFYERYTTVGVNVDVFDLVLPLNARPRFAVPLQEIGRLDVVHVLCIVTGVLGVLLELRTQSRDVLPTITEGKDETFQEELALVDGISIAELCEPILGRLAALGLGLFQELGHGS